MRLLSSVLFLMLLVVPLASAELIFSQPNAIYNRGDVLRMTATLQSPNAATGSFQVALICPNGEELVFQQPLSVTGQQAREVQLEFPLTSAIVGDLKDNCYFRGTFGSMAAQSQTFILSKAITVETSLNVSLINPGERIGIQGTARKANGQAINGVAEMTLSSTNLTVSTYVSNGIFNLSLLTPTTLPAGEQTLTTRVVERDAENAILNEGMGEDSFSVRSVLKTLEISVENASLQPGSSREVMIDALDQSGLSLTSEAVFTIYNPAGDRVGSTVIQTGQGISFSTNTSSMPGYWKLEATIDSLISKKLVYVSEFENADFIMENSTLLIINTGNVLYQKAVEISIGNATEVREVSLGVGETKRFKLRAPDAEYDISVSDGARSSMISGVVLTGRAIDIGEEGSLPRLSFAWLSVFLIGLLSLVFVTNFYVQKRRSYGSNEPITAFKPLKKATFTDTIDTAASSYSTGSKQEASVVAIRFNASDKHLSKQVESALETHRSKATSVYAQGNHWIMLFDQNRAGAQHGLMALKTAKALEESLKSNAQNSYGIGVNRGEAMVDARESSRVTGFGTLIPLAKKLATSAQGEVLVSEGLYRSMISSIRADKVTEHNAWKVKSVIDRESHGSFLSGFLRRQGK